MANGYGFPEETWPETNPDPPTPMNVTRRPRGSDPARGALRLPAGSRRRTPRAAGAAKHCGLSPRASLACAIARQPLHDIPIHALGSRSHQERRKFAPRRAQSGLVRGGRREPISRQPPRADLPRDLPTNSWHRQEPATARLGVTGSPAHEFLQIDHSGKIRPNGSPWRAAIRLAGPI